MLLGYSARAMWLPHKASSVDAVVWPTVFDADRGLKKPSWTGYVQEHWDDLERLERELTEQWNGQWKPVSLIAVTLAAETCTPPQLAEWRSRIGVFHPPEIRQPSRLLGYDVADFWLFSALADFARGDQLNEHGLFETLAAARSFIAVAEERAPEHAPFFAFGVWLLDTPILARMSDEEKEKKSVSESLRDWGIDVQRFEERAKESLGNAKDDLSEIAGTLRHTLVQAKDVVVGLQKNGAPVAAELKSGFERAWHEIEAAFKAARERAKERKSESDPGGDEPTPSGPAAPPD